MRVSGDAAPFRKGALSRVRFDYAAHTFTTHTRRDARDIGTQRSARISVSLSISPSVLRSSFKFPLSPLSRREKYYVFYLILTTTSLLLMMTLASRTFPSSLLVDPTSTRDLFTNPSRSTIPADWLAARRVSREHVGATRAVVAVVFGPNGCHSREVRTFTAYERELRVNVAATRARRRRRPRIVVRTRAGTRHEPPRTASTFHHGVYPRITSLYTRST